MHIKFQRHFVRLRRQQIDRDREDNHIENGDEKCSDGNCYKLKSTFKKRQQHFAHLRGYREQIYISKSNMYFAPVVCNLFEGIQNKCIFFGIYMYVEKMYAKRIRKPFRIYCVRKSM